MSARTESDWICGGYLVSCTVTVRSHLRVPTAGAGEGDHRTGELFECTENIPISTGCPCLVLSLALFGEVAAYSVYQ